MRNIILELRNLKLLDGGFFHDYYRVTSEYSPDLLHKKLENSDWPIVMVLKGGPLTLQKIFWKTLSLSLSLPERVLEPTDTSKRPIRNRYLGHLTGYQPIRDQYFLIRSVPGNFIWFALTTYNFFLEKRFKIIPITIKLYISTLW
eukprot:sb/3473921/